MGDCTCFVRVALQKKCFVAQLAVLSPSNTGTLNLMNDCTCFVRVALQNKCFVARDLLGLLVVGCNLTVAFVELLPASLRYYMCELHLRKLHHFGPIIYPWNIMPYLGVHLALG